MGRKALPLPGDTRQDLWIVQDLAQRMGEKWNYQHVSEVFEEMARLMPALDNITWERVEREDHVTYPTDAPDKPGRDVVFDKGFPRPGGFGKLVAAKLTPPDETPDHDYPFILTTGRQLEHWHTGAMTRRASVLDALEPSAVASVSRGTLEKLGLKPGDRLRVTTRRGEVELASRQDDAIPDGVIFIPFALRRGGGQYIDQPGARSVRQDSGIQILRGEGGAGRGAAAGGGVGHNFPQCSVGFSSPTTRMSIRPINSGARGLGRVQGGFGLRPGGGVGAQQHDADDHGRQRRDRRLGRVGDHRQHGERDPNGAGGDGELGGQ